MPHISALPLLLIRPLNGCIHLDVAIHHRRGSELRGGLADDSDHGGLLVGRGRRLGEEGI